MVEWNKMDRLSAPVLEQVTRYVASPLWENILEYLRVSYGAGPVFEYSGCAVPGWNAKYKKAGRALCTLYPMTGYFVALVVIGNREKAEFDLVLPLLTAYTQRLYEETKDKNGLCWLMLEVRDEAVLADAKTCMALRRRPNG